MPTEPQCDLCGSRDAVVVAERDRQGNPLRTVVCAGCGLMWTDPLPSPEELAAFYRDEYRQEYKGVEQPRLRHMLRNGRLALARYRRMLPLLGPCQRTLDIGSGGGEMVYVLSRAGFQASGIEPHQGFAAYAREVLRLNVRTVRVQELDPAAEQYEAISLFHVLEHLDQPRAYLRHLHALLRPGGVVFIEVPNTESADQHPRRRYHRAHLHHFTALTLERLLERSGFRLRERANAADRNLWVSAERAEPAEVDGRIPGHAEHLRRELARQTVGRYLLHPGRLLRWPARLARMAAEARTARRYRSGAELLAAEVAPAVQPTRQL